MDAIHSQRGYDAIVVGLGVMGASACWQLARRGQRVLGLDRYGVPNAMGSSHGHTRIFRLAYFEHPGYVPLLRAALQGWRMLETESQVELLTLCGGLYMGQPGSQLIQGAVAAAGLHGLELLQLENADLRSRWPQFAVADDMVGVHEPQAGYMLAEDSVAALARQAVAHGAEVAQDQLLDWTADATGVEVRTAQNTHRAQTLILCPGAYASVVLKTEAVRLAPTRQLVSWFTPRRADWSEAPRLPVWAADLPDGRFYYGIPHVPGSPGLKFASHRPGLPATPGLALPPASDGEQTELAQLTQAWLPDDAGALRQTLACLYENSPDGHFILDRHPAHDNVFLFCGGSGHGFKFAPVVGEVLADLATCGRTAHDIDFLGLSRFR